MEIFVSLGVIAFANLPVWIAPGPNMFAAMSASLEHGRKHGIATGLGSACALFWGIRGSGCARRNAFSTDAATRLFRWAKRWICTVFGFVFSGLGGVLAHAAPRRAQPF